MNTKEASKIVGKLSKTSKMPCYSYNLPATKCITGAKMAKIKGTTCYDCYALKGMYNFPVVKEAMMRRYEAINHPEWVFAMAVLINSKSQNILDGTIAGRYKALSTYKKYLRYAKQHLTLFIGCLQEKHRY